jgi:hypothetical protein
MNAAAAAHRPRRRPGRSGSPPAPGTRRRWRPSASTGAGALPIPKTKAEKFREVKKLVPLTIAAERMEEFSPGLDKDLLALLQATAEMEMADVAMSYGPVVPEQA